MTKKQNKIDSNLTVTTHKGVSESILSLLKKTILGTPGKLRYKHTETENIAERISGLNFIQIKKRTRVLGTAGFIERDITIGSSTIKSLYVRYLSVYNPFKRPKKTTSKTGFKNKTNSLKDDIERVFIQELEKPFSDSEKKGIYYAYVESDNLLSKKLCHSFGFKEIRVIHTFLFSRFFPKKQKSASKIDTKKYGQYRGSLRHFHKDHNFVFTDSLEDLGTCFILEEKGEDVAGIRAIPVQWEIVDMPGLKGFLMLKVLPKIPFLNRIFKPDKLRFLAFDSLWHRKGDADKVQKLMEHACSELGFYMGMIWADQESTTSDVLLSKNRLGLLHKINGVVSADLMVRDINMNQQDFSKLKNSPAFVSSIDMI
ncbi:MAG: hypothetical protein ROO71_02135 [Balneola sp.]